MERIANDSSFGVTLEQLQEILRPENYVGRAPEQTVEFINEYVKPALETYHLDEIHHSEISL